MEFLRVESISKRKGKQVAVDDVSFILSAGERLGIAGETGSGKSTLLKIIAGFEQTDAGQVIFKGNKVFGPMEKLIPGHPEIAYLSQHFELRNHYRVEEVLEYATLLEEEKARQIFDLCRITPLLKRKTDQLSGGERQRIALARLLVGSPKLLILDEPFSNLDMMHKNIIRSVLTDIESELAITCILVSHDPTDLLSWAQRIIAIKDGKIVQDDTPERIYRQPTSEYVAALMGDYISLSPTLAALLSGKQEHTTQPVLIRPENIQFKNNAPASGLITACRFFGSYSELTINVSGEILRMRSSKTELKTGMTVRIWVDPEEMIYPDSYSG